jgi:hypothetical protein
MPIFCVQKYTSQGGYKKMSRFGIKEVADVIFFNIQTGKPELFFDTLKLSNLENAAETVYAQGGRGNGRLIGWDFGRTATFNMQDALLSEQSLGMLAGGAPVEGVAKIHKREVLIVVDNAGAEEVTLSEIPVNLAGIVVYATTDGKFHGVELTKGTLTAKVLGVSGGTIPVAAGDKVVVYYQYNSATTAQTITIASDKFPAYYTVVAQTIVRNEGGFDEPIQVVIPKAKLQVGFTMTMDAANVSVFDFNMDVFKDTDSTDMVQFIKY